LPDFAIIKLISKNNHKKFLSVLLILLLAFSFVACGNSSGNSNNNSSEQSNDPVTQGGDNRVATMRMILMQAQQARPSAPYWPTKMIF
jgi:hypothetical protein